MRLGIDKLRSVVSRNTAAREGYSQLASIIARRVTAMKVRAGPSTVVRISAIVVMASITLLQVVGALPLQILHGQDAPTPFSVYLPWLPRAGGPTGPGTITGRVTRLDGATSVAGATVLVLREGIFEAASATADESGRFVVRALPPGTYDLQAGAAGFATETIIDVSVGGGGTAVNFKLATREETLSAAGIAPSLLLEDSDSDGIPDSVEAKLGSNPADQDTNGDGIPDGVESVAGLLPQHGPLAATADKPRIISPKAESRLPIPPVGMAGPSVPIVFAPIPGGTRYEMILSSGNDDQPLLVRSADFIQGDLLLGHGGMALLQLPPDAAAGKYSLRLKGFHGAAPLGQASDPVTLTLVDTTPAPFSPSSSLEFAGDTDILASSVFIPKGVTVRLSSGVLRIWSLGSIDIDGDVLGGPGAAPEGAGVSIELSAVGDVTIRGSVFAGRGADGQPAS
ncbi:MAG: carboxypeptidase regulatory-like domain-containing protein, partial [Chloroflexi bacterium]|nr:carboxypeptidase regulatory-like domain-containing protein [Chloroflexota bacterium]